MRAIKQADSLTIGQTGALEIIAVKQINELDILTPGSDLTVTP